MEKLEKSNRAKKAGGLLVTGWRGELIKKKTASGVRHQRGEKNTRQQKKQKNINEIDLGSPLNESGRFQWEQNEKKNLGDKIQEQADTT